MKLQKGKPIAFKVDDEFLEFITKENIEVTENETGLNLVKRLMYHNSTKENPKLKEDYELQTELINKITEENSGLKQVNSDLQSNLTKANQLINDIYEHIEDLLLLQFALKEENKDFTIKQLTETIIKPYQEKGYLIVSEEIKQKYYEQINRD